MASEFRRYAKPHPEWANVSFHFPLASPKLEDYTDLAIVPQ